MKLAFDFSLVLAALALCLLLTLHRVEVLREGTLLAAFAVSFCLRFTMPLLRPMRRLLLVRKPARWRERLSFPQASAFPCPFRRGNARINSSTFKAAHSASHS